MKKCCCRSATAVLAWLFLSMLPQARAAVVEWDSNQGFVTNFVIISLGGSVTWTNVDATYTVQVVSDAPMGNPNYFSFSLAPSNVVWLTFTNQGTLGYHSDFSDQGIIVVNIPPIVAITNPANHAVFAPPGAFEIQAEAIETADDEVSQVEFFLASNGTTNSIMIDALPPFSASVTNLIAGSYVLIAVANDFYGGYSTNVINVSVEPISLSAPRWFGGEFLFDVTGLAVGKTNIVLTSSNLTLWTGVRTNVASNSSATITNPVVAGQQLYRVLQLP